MNHLPSATALIVGAAVATAPLGLEAVAHASVQLGYSSHLTKAAAYGKTTAFSVYDSRRHAYALMFRRLGEHPHRLPVRPRSVPFDVDLGPDSSGRLTVVYSRCRREPDVQNAEAQGQVLDYTTGRGCDLYRSIVAHPREHVLTGPSTRKYSEVLPTIWRGKIGFARRDDRTRGRVALVLGSTKSEWRRILRSPGPGSASATAWPQALDLRGGSLAYVWTRNPDTCAVNTVDPDARIEPQLTEAYVSRSTGSPTRLASACNEDAAAAVLAGIAWHCSRVVYGIEGNAADGSFQSRIFERSPSSAEAVQVGAIGPGNDTLDYVSFSAAGPVVTLERRPPTGPFGGLRILALTGSGAQ